jgi:hypothetical protein
MILRTNEIPPDFDNGRPRRYVNFLFRSTTSAIQFVRRNTTRSCWFG